MEVLEPLQIEVLLPAFAAGAGFTVIITVAVFVQPVEVIFSVRVYVVVVVGDTDGFEVVEL